MALLIDPPTDIMAFLGGYFSGFFEADFLKILFALLLITISIFMLLPVKERNIQKKSGLGYWHRTFGEHQYSVNLWYTLPLMAIIGFLQEPLGFLGHSLNGNINLGIAIPFTLLAIIGGVLGSRFALKSKPKNLQTIFAMTNLLAAILMIINIVK